MQLDIGFLDDATRPKVPPLTGLTTAQRAPGRHLVMIHNHFRSEMQVLRDLIDRAKSGTESPDAIKAETASLSMIENYEQFGNLCGQHCQIINIHHSIEDQHIFPALRAQSEAYKAVADRLEQEHVIVHELLVRLVAAINTLADDPHPVNFTVCTATYDSLERVLLSHFGYEEEQIGDALGYFGIGL